MNKIAVAIAFLFIATGAYAQGRRTLKDIDKELKQTKSTATAMALIESIADTPPQTDEEVAVLGQLMDRYPTQGQKALIQIKDPRLAKAVMKECDRQVAKFKADKDKDWKTLPDAQQRERFNALLNSHAMIAMLGNLKNKAATPYLKRYITPEYNGILSYVASQALGRLGDEAVLDEMVRDIGKTKEIDLSAFGDKAFVRVIKELDEPNISTERKFALINQIKGSRSPERKKALKELALKHKDAGVRDRSAQALLNSIIVNPDSSDIAFISEWVNRTKNDETGYWAVTSIRVSHGNGDKSLDNAFIKILLDVLTTSTYDPTRSEAAYSLGIFKIKEAVPYLEEALMDKDSGTRGSALIALGNILGKDYRPKYVHPADLNVHEEIIYVKSRPK